MKHSSLGMVAALALAASAGTGSAVEVLPHERRFEPPVPSPPGPRKRKSGKRLDARIRGGNWQGKQYLSYAEHDECTRAALAHPYEPEVAYMKRREAIEARR